MPSNMFHQMSFLVGFKIGDEVEHLVIGKGVVKGINASFDEDSKWTVRYLVDTEAKGQLLFEESEMHEPGTIAYVERNSGRGWMY